MKKILGVFGILVSAHSAAQASEVICDPLLLDETVQAATVIIDLGEDGGMGEVVGGEKPAKTPENTSENEKKIRRPELELPLQIVPTGEKKKPKIPPPVPTTPVPPSKKPDKYSIN